jgi:hypothetical protein
MPIGQTTLTANSFTIERIGRTSRVDQRFLFINEHQISTTALAPLRFQRETTF